MCQTCNVLTAHYTAADEAAKGKPAGAREYRVALRWLRLYHRHFDETHRRGGPCRGYYCQPELETQEGVRA